jgi:nucleotide-binding universal stress UspA family protein
MYKRILIPLENSATDRTILDHVLKLAKFCGARVLLIHVADGWAARNMARLNLRESEEMAADRAYLKGVHEELKAQGLDVDSVLAAGEPAAEIAAAAEREGCDLIAMATHGHRGLNDVVRGSVASELRHASRVPVLMVRRQDR